MRTISDSICKKFIPKFQENNRGCSTWRRGDIVKHPKGYDVVIKSGCFLDSTYGRLSNWWTWIRLDNGKEETGYGWK